jgi:hypothetical protein
MGLETDKALSRLAEAVDVLIAEECNKEAEPLERLLAYYLQPFDGVRQQLDPEDVRLLSQLHAQRVVLLRLARGLPVSTDLLHGATVRHEPFCVQGTTAATAAPSSSAARLHSELQPRKVQACMRTRRFRRSEAFKCIVVHEKGRPIRAMRGSVAHESAPVPPSAEGRTWYGSGRRGAATKLNSCANAWHASCMGLSSRPCSLLSVFTDKTVVV